MSELNNQKTIQLAISAECANSVLFRNNTGRAWQSNKIMKNPKGFPPGSIVLIEPRPLSAGLCNGGSDLIGWTSVEITPDMVGQKVALFTAVEVKTKTGKPSKEQLNFIKVVAYAGGKSGIARTPEEGVSIIKGN